MEIVVFVLIGLVTVGTIGSCIGVTIYFSMRESEHPISCPNCGEFFRLNWKKIFPAHLIRNYNETSRILRCPHCNKKDICKVHIDKF